MLPPAIPPLAIFADTFHILPSFSFAMILLMKFRLRCLRLRLTPRLFSIFSDSSFRHAASPPPMIFDALLAAADVLIIAIAMLIFAKMPRFSSAVILRLQLLPIPERRILITPPQLFAAMTPLDAFRRHFPAPPPLIIMPPHFRFHFSPLFTSSSPFFAAFAIAVFRLSPADVAAWRCQRLAAGCRHFDGSFHAMSLMPIRRHSDTLRALHGYYSIRRPADSIP